MVSIFPPFQNKCSYLGADLQGLILRTGSTLYHLLIKLNHMNAPDLVILSE
jgi:hypothetical protein